MNAQVVSSLGTSVPLVPEGRSDPSSDVEAVGRLRRQWALVTTITAAALLVGTTVVATVLGSPSRWLFGAVPAQMYVLAGLWSDLDDNRPTANAALRPALGTPNLLTLARGLVVGTLGGFLLVSPPTGTLAWAPGALYGLNAALDKIDGFVARWTGRTTLLGESLDMRADTLGFLLAPPLAVHYGALPTAYLALSAARPAFVVAFVIRRSLDLPVYSLDDTSVRRPLAGLQMAFLTGALLPVFDASVAVLAPVLLFASLAWFLRDWLVVSGRLDPS